MEARKLISPSETFSVIMLTTCTNESCLHKTIRDRKRDKILFDSKESVECDLHSQENLHWTHITWNTASKLKLEFPIHFDIF